MKISELLNLDLRTKGNKKILVDALESNILFADKSVDIDTLEDAVKKMSKKYLIDMGYIMHGPIETMYWCAMIKETTKHAMLKTIYGNSIWEVFAKSVLYMYSYIKNVIQRGQINGS